MSAVLESPEEVRGLDKLPPDALYEVIDGEAKEIQPMSAAAVIVANELAFHLGQARKSRRDLVVTEMLFVLPEPINRRRRPDVAFVPEERTRGVWPPPDSDDSRRPCGHSDSRGGSHQSFRLHERIGGKEDRILRRGRLDGFVHLSQDSHRPCS